MLDQYLQKDLKRDEDYSTWTACELYGHNFVTDEEQPNHHYCTDCGETCDE